MTLPKDTYFEFSLTGARADGPAEQAARSFFKAAGIDDHQVVLTVGRSQVRWSFYTQSEIKLKQTLRIFTQKRPPSLKTKIRTLGPKEWRDRWQLYFHTMPLGRGYSVVPIWEKSKHKNSVSKRTPIYLDPCGAFGSGAHETTRLMVRMLESFKGSFSTFLDIGTGTGILTVVASHLGALKVEGVDIDPQSTKAAKRNYTLNHRSGGVFHTQDIRKRRRVRGGQFEMVTANFISADLIDCSKAIVSAVAPGGYLLLSGISLKNLPGFLKAFKPVQLRLQKTLRGRSWAGLIYQKKAAFGKK